MAKTNDNQVLGERQAQVLAAVIREYIRSAEPVGSHTIVAQYGVDASSATVRNDMAVLEEAGYLASPHTSAGRIPTEKAYHFYIQHFLQPTPLPKNERQAIVTLCATVTKDNLKRTAKVIAEFSEEGVFVSFGRDDLYYTGINNLLQQPEFSVGEVVDHFEEVVRDVFDVLPRDVGVLLGQNNPFGRDCSIIVGRYHNDIFGEGLLGIFGPTRMDYDRNISRLRFVIDALSE